MAYEDPLTWDHQVRILSEFEEHYELSLRLDPDAADAAGPFIGVPAITDRATFADVRALPPELPLRSPLERWMFRLTDARVNASLNRRMAQYWRSEPVKLDTLKETTVTRAALTFRVLCDKPARVVWWSALETALADAPVSASDLWQRRDELAKRAGFASVFDAVDPVEGMLALVEQWQLQTDELASNVLPREPFGLLEAALCTEATQGWPAHINAPTMARLLSEPTWLRMARVKEPRWPALMSPASFTRALFHLGESLARAWAPESYPFVLSLDPWKLERYRLGALVSSLALNESWHRRVLGLSREQARAHVRAISRSALLATRGLCLKLGLRSAAVESTNSLRKAFADLTYRLFRTELPAPMAGFVPRIGRSDAQRLLGLWLGLADHCLLTQAFDDDWYRNPKAIEFLRGQALERPGAQVSREQLPEVQMTSLRWLSSSLELY